MVALLETFKKQEKLHRRYAFQMLLDIKAMLEKQPTLVRVSVPEDSKFTVCGDIHGQFYDLMNVFSLNGLPSEDNPYVSRNLVFFYPIFRLLKRNWIFWDSL
jgi:serine/threonine-protein phosphatase 5